MKNSSITVNAFDGIYSFQSTISFNTITSNGGNGIEGGGVVSNREGVLPTLQHLQRLTSYGIGYRSFTEQYFDSCGIFKDVVVHHGHNRQTGTNTDQRTRAGGP